MVNLSKYLFCVIVICVSSCKDAKLIIPKEVNLTNKLNLNGYFYLKTSVPFDNTNDVYFLYENGIILYVGSLSANDEITISNYINNEVLKYKTVYKSKSGWGLYKITNDKIDFEIWFVRNAGEKIKTFKYTGDILNKNTFKINNIYNGYTKKNVLIEDLFEFRQFSPKPDSTNNFIK